MPWGHDQTEHTADIGLSVWGDTLEEVFEGAAHGMYGLMCTWMPDQKRTKKELLIEADDLGALMVDWLSELLFLFDASGFLLDHVDSIEVTGTSLRASVIGSDASEVDITPMDQVKAVTYHGLQVTHSNTWKVEVLFDV